MKSFSVWWVAILLLFNTLVLAHPQPVADIQSVSTRDHVERDDDFFADVKELWKRKGGGGGGGKGGSGGSSGGKGGSSSSGSSSSGYVPSSPGIGGVSGNQSAQGLARVGSSTSSSSPREVSSSGTRS